MGKLKYSSKLFLKQNSSTILTCIGGVGVVATAIATAKATPKALRLLEQAEDEKGEDLTKLEIVKVVGPAYIPAVAVGTATIACIFGANMLNKRQQAALMSAYALLDQSYKEYKGKVKEMLGEESDAEIRAEIAKDKYDETDISVDDGKVLFYEEFSGRYFESTIEDVQKAEYQLNREISVKDYAYLNEFYAMLDIPETPAGWELGWSTDGNLSHYWQKWIDFSHERVVMDDGLECIIVSMFTEPYLEFEEYC